MCCQHVDGMCAGCYILARVDQEKNCWCMFTTTFLILFCSQYQERGGEKYQYVSLREWSPQFVVICIFTALERLKANHPCRLPSHVTPDSRQAQCHKTAFRTTLVRLCDTLGAVWPISATRWQGSTIEERQESCPHISGKVFPFPPSVSHDRVSHCHRSLACLTQFTGHTANVYCSSWSSLASALYFNLINTVLLLHSSSLPVMAPSLPPCFNCNGKPSNLIKWGIFLLTRTLAYTHCHVQQSASGALPVVYGNMPPSSDWMW